ncbi:MAG: multiheme c-type cytochrome [Acidobacteriota bacterium]
MDAGNFAALGIPSAAIRSQGMIEGLNRIGYTAVLVGERELAGGYEEFLKLKEKAKFPFVSANFVFEDDNTPVADPYVITTVTHGSRRLKIGILGLTRYNTGFLKSTRAGRNIIVASPFETVRRLVPDLRSKCDVVVLLTALSISQSRQLARQVQGIDLIIGANGGVVSQDNDTSAGVPIVYPGNQGKYLAEVRLFAASGDDGSIRTKRTFHYLNRDYPVDEKMQDLVDSILAQENEINRNLASAEVKRPVRTPGVASFVGAEACAPCHSSAMEAWRLSSHAHAFKTLVDKHQDFNEECVACHAVGFGRTGGFVNAKATPDLVNVQCESCHGPGSVHVEGPAHGFGAAGARSCLGCHDPQNSPEFDFYTFWPRIRH